MNHFRLLHCAAVTLLAAPPVAAQGGASHDSCPDRETPYGVLSPGTPEAWCALFQSLQPLPLGTASLELPSEHAPTLSCGELALAVGVGSAAAGLLLALVINSFVPGEVENRASSYALAGGVMFGVGASYALLRCAVRHPAESWQGHHTGRQVTAEGGPVAPPLFSFVELLPESSR